MFEKPKDQMSVEEFNGRAKAFHTALGEMLRDLAVKHDAVDGVVMYSLAAMLGTFIMSSTRGDVREGINTFITLIDTMAKHTNLPITVGSIMGSGPSSRADEFLDRMQSGSPGHMTPDQKRKLN